ncbi:MAG: CDF family Co(II)/Ni(II) efflux transporter DmeF [Chlorobiaceae bacterium]|nr:CDF family Co(II)/Ni(II) efflux transporter DmeF [Chlorobiaceae bacterium]
MDTQTSDTGQPEHSHIFDEGNPLAEKRTKWALILTAITMVLEIAGGWTFNSMALLADGWHMSSHALALGLSLLAYRAARHFARDTRFSFGTWKIEVLGGYTSAVFLVMLAALMLFESIERLITPTPIRYDQAIALAVFGLTINLLSAWLLNDSGHHHHHHGHDHEDGHEHHHDLNLRAAYIHVITDAATSLLAILALFGGRFWNAVWLDPLMGIAGAVVVSVWAFGLLRDSGRVLLDAEMDTPLAEKIRQTIRTGAGSAAITDLHLWRIGKSNYSCIIALTTPENLTADGVKKLLERHKELSHITIEVNRIPNRADRNQ